MPPEANAVPPRQREEDVRPKRCEGRPPSQVNPALLHSEVLLDMAHEMFVDVRVPGNRLLLSGVRVEVHVVPAAMPEKHASGLDELPDELHALHTAISFVR